MYDVKRILAALAALSLFALPTIACSATQTVAQDHPYHSTMYPFVAAQSDADAIGSLDPDAAQAEFNRNGRPLQTASYTPTSVSRHPVR